MATTPSVIESGAELAASVPSDFFNDIGGEVSVGAEEAPESESGDETTGDAAIETLETPAAVEDAPLEPVGAEEPVVEAVEEPTPAAAPEKPVAETKPGEELPEGVVKGKDRNGKEGLFVEPKRWDTVYGNHKLVQQTSELLGEPVTMEALQLRNDAYMAQERLYADLTSGDVQAQGNVIGYMLDEMARAREAGEIRTDAAVPFASTFYSTIKEKSPDAYATLRFSAAKDLISEMFREASAKGDEPLFLSAQHFARALAGFDKSATDVAAMREVASRAGLPFYTKAEMEGLGRGADPLTALRAENARLLEQVNGRQTTNQAAQFDQWHTATRAQVSTAVLDEAVKPALSTVEEAWKPFPADYQRLVVDPLHREVTKTLRDDKGFSDKIQLLDAQARRAASAQRREQVGAQIRQAYTNRAKLAADAVKGPILSFAAKFLKEQSQGNNARREAAQGRTAPKGTASAPPRSLIPGDLPQFSGGIFDPAIAAKQAALLIG